VTTGAIALRSVLNTYRTARAPVVDLELSVGRVSTEHVRVTRAHLFWVEGSGWVRADALGAQPLWSTEGSTEARLSGHGFDDDPELTTVYNLEVAEFHSYFVGHSHVLVHNGNASNDGCPETNPVPASARPPRSFGSKIECGDTGSYYEQLGGWDKDNSSMRMSRPSNGLERDHIPSSAALQTRATRLLDDLATRMTEGRCRELTEDEQRALTTARAQAAKQLQTEASYDGFAVAEPPQLHAAGRTYRNKNTREQYESDSRDLALAAQKDARALEDAIKAGVVDDVDCVVAMWGVLQAIGGKTQEDYDRELGGLAQAQLESSGFSQIIRNTCAGHDLRIESQRH